MTAGEKIGAALAKAVKSAAAEWKKGEQAPVMYRTNLRDVRRLMASSAMTVGSICRCNS
jgi:hypothetical protein